MSRQIRITSVNVSLLADLNDGKTADAIWSALPITATANTWGDEVYFSITVKIGPENGQAIVNAGDLGYWPPGNAFCIFFGLTPMSRGREIRPASPVNVFGRIVEDAELFKAVRDGDTVTIEKV